MLFVLDNYDSFTYNLVQLFGELGAEPVVYRHDALTVEQVLAVEPASLPKDLVITAWSADRPKDAEIMAMKHRRHPIYGVQFHPESIGTDHGKELLDNFLRIAHATV